MKQIKLTVSHRGGVNCDSFSGRPNGKDVRQALSLDEKDKDNEHYTVTIPEDTISFNPSFYLGLFFDSIKYFNDIEKFKQKYSFDFSNLDDESRSCLEDNISQCERKASNELLGYTGLDFLKM